MLNRVILQGRMVRDPEVKDVGGFSLAEFTVAWSEKYKDNETKCFMKCKAWRAKADFVGKYFSKGQEIIIEGKMITEEWEKDGQKQSRLICQVDDVNFCGSKANDNSNYNSNANPAPSPDDFMTIPDSAAEELPFK